jgi:outer membrane lipoprotein-sorting protein
MTITAWTRGREDSIFWIAEPAKDRGNGTLKKGQEMWLYNPKVNRVIKLPPSMMSQSWQGSDFSNNDLAKSDNIVDQYTHKIIATEKHQGKKVYVVRSTPKPGAPVIWGMQELKIREDSIVVKQTFFDEDKKPVKILEMEKIENMGGRLYPVRWKMSKADEQGKYTVIEHLQLEFDISINDRMFTLSSLKHPKF